MFFGHGTPLITKNLSNQPTAPANQELRKQEKGRESLAAAWRRRQHQRRWRRCKEWRRCTARQRQSDCSSADAAAGAARWWCAARRLGVAASAVQPKRSGGAQHDCVSAVGAARMLRRIHRHCPQMGQRKCLRMPPTRRCVFELGRGRRDDSVDGIVIVAMTAAPVATSTAVTDAPPLPPTTPMATPTTLFVKLNLIYYYYLFIYHYVDRK